MRRPLELDASGGDAGAMSRPIKPKHLAVTRRRSPPSHRLHTAHTRPRLAFLSASHSRAILSCMPPPFAAHPSIPQERVA